MHVMTTHYVDLLRKFAEAPDVQLNLVFGFALFSAVLFFLVLIGVLISPAEKAPAKVYIEE